MKQYDLRWRIITLEEHGITFEARPLTLREYPIVLAVMNLFSAAGEGRTLKDSVEPVAILEVLKSSIRKVEGLGKVITDEGERDATVEDLATEGLFFTLLAEIVGRLISISALTNEEAGNSASSAPELQKEPTPSISYPE